MSNSFPLLEKNIRNQFIKMLVTLVIIFSVIMIIFVLYVKSTNDQLKEEIESVSEKAQIVDGLAKSYNGIIFRARGYYAFQNPQELELMNENIAAFESYLNQFSMLHLTDEEKKLYGELVKFNENYQAVILPNALSYVDDNDYESLRKLSNDGANDLINQFISYTNTYDKNTKVNLNNLYSTAVKKAQQFTLISILLGILIVLFVAIIMRRVLFNLIQPIEQLTDATNELASGRFIDLGDLVKKEDELGILANSFYKMTLSIQEKEEVLTTQNEELVAQQDELQGNQEQLQRSLDQLQKYNELNHVLTFTLDKEQLLKNLHNYLTDIYSFDTSILYFIDSHIYVSKGLSEQTAEQLVSNFNIDKQVRLQEEKSFIITREIPVNAQEIAQSHYCCYDLYSSIFNSEGQLVAVLMATREGYPFTKQELVELNGLMNRVSIAFERIHMYEEVERSRQLNQNIIDTVNEGIQLVSVAGEVVLNNKALSTIIDSHNDENDSQHVSLKHLQEICDQPDELAQFFTESIVEDFTDTRTFRYSISQNTQLFIEVYATCVYKDDEKMGTMFVHRDITKEYEIDQMKSELVSTVSHELRTPLSSVLGFTELLLAKEVKPERQKKYIETIHKEAVRLTNLINDFLDLQRMESGKQQYTMQQLSVDELAIDIVNRFRHEQKHHVHLIDKAKYVNILGDQERLVQLFINLIGNAIKFSPAGGDVTITLENINHMLQISIKDQGIGIPKLEIPKLFQKFKRIDNTSRRKIGGTGLGLSISREIIKKHGGDIWLESEEGNGTTVIFNLPLNQKNTLNTSFEENDFDIQTGLNVMIIEDDLSLALLLSEELKSKGFTVIYHDNPKRAFEEALQTPLVAIIIDLMLGDDINGWDLIAQLKERDETKNIPILVSSALDETREYVDKYKVDKYFTKPYPPEELSKTLVTILSQSNEIS
ncbi:ATP-binding protein [Solibacillus sp. MA9]|uniref:histidine kinase n=1 Tax=Solibacillus palustris TaxID=2908203 RepID=A0ABS9UA24_9BACL|nr:ATP-binding protein [Solibacillus sp. MA9]MCH7321179.1 ATP-binding protein [Solibacillus sp. MA9]